MAQDKDHKYGYTKRKWMGKNSDVLSKDKELAKGLKSGDAICFELRIDDTTSETSYCTR